MMSEHADEKLQRLRGNRVRDEDRIHVAVIVLKDVEVSLPRPLYANTVGAKHRKNMRSWLSAIPCATA